jgi:hypothetical protein
MIVIAGWVLTASPSSATTPTSVTISTVRSDAGDSWSATGAITDSGRFVDPVEFFAGSSSSFHATRIYQGSQGTFTVQAAVLIQPSSDPEVGFVVTGRWAVISGTGAYADLHGTGGIHEELDLSPCCALVGTWSGFVHHD